MKKFILSILSVFILMSLVSAVKISNEQYYENDSLSMTYFTNVQYTTTNFDNVLSQPYESYVLYSVTMDDWNKVNPANQVTYCNLSIFYNSFRSYLIGSGNITGLNIVPLFSKVFVANDENEKYFVRLNKGDSYSSYMTCVFANESSRVTIIPASIQIIAPTWECKECQYLEWLKQQRALDKAAILNGYTAQMWQWIAQIIQIVYENVIVFFWIFLILIAVGALFLVFFGFYWFYHYIRKVSR